MMTKVLVLLSSMLLLLGCAGNTLSASGSGGNMAGAATITTPPDSGLDSPQGLDLDVVQTAAPPVMGGETSIDVQYTFEVKNTSPAPATVRRITIWSAGGGAFQIENRSRTFRKTIAPGTTEKFPFWARATGVSSLSGTNAPVTLRVELQVDAAEGTRKATFLRAVNGTTSIGVSRE